MGDLRDGHLGAHWHAEHGEAGTCIVERAALPECSTMRVKGRAELDTRDALRDPYHCETWRGRRKHVDRVATVALTKVHKVLECDPGVGKVGKRPCQKLSLSAREVWLDHFQSAPFRAERQCICGADPLPQEDRREGQGRRQERRQGRKVSNKAKLDRLGKAGQRLRKEALARLS